MQPVQQFVKAMAARTDFEVRRRHSGLRPDTRFGLDVLGLLVDDLVRREGSSKVSLLQVGANDGKDEDSVNPILARHAIRSILCEPLLESFALLEREYQGTDHATVTRCAIGPTDGSLELFRIEGDDKSVAATKIASASQEHVAMFLKLRNRAEETLATETVPCLTVSSLLAQHDLRGVDILVSDCEGMDHLVCSQALSLPEPPSIIQFEYHNIPVADARTLMDRLTEMGYLFVRSGLDIVASRTRNG